MNAGSKTIISNKIYCNIPLGEGVRENEETINLHNFGFTESLCSSYTFSFWMYVENWTSGTVKRVLVRGNPGGNTDNDAPEGSGAYLNPGIYLFPNTNKLMIRVMTSPKTLGVTNMSLYPSQEAIGEGYDPQRNTKLLPADDQDGTNYLADIPNVPLQRWVHVAVTLDDRIIDVYMNGKLARSGILQGPVVKYTGAKDEVHIGKGKKEMEDGYDGWMSCLKIYDYALTASDVYKLYSKGTSGCGKSNFGETPIDKYRLEAGVTNLTNNKDHTVSFNL